MRYTFGGYWLLDSKGRTQRDELTLTRSFSGGDYWYGLHGDDAAFAESNDVPAQVDGCVCQRDHGMPG